MLKGINGSLYFDLTKLIDPNSFKQLHPEISRGIALGMKDAAQGNPYPADSGGSMNLKYYDDAFTPLYKVYEEMINLPDDDPIKINGIDLEGNDLAAYLKYALGGYDLYSFHALVDFEEGWKETNELLGIKNSAKYFPGVINWIKKLIDDQVFSHVGRAIFFIQEAGGISFEHSDPPADQEHPELLSEFIHVRPNLDRPFYLRDLETAEKVYIDTEIAYLNDKDYHGGDPVLVPTYSFRVDGIFTEEFRNKINEYSRK
jgi:hypothetical protein